LPVTLVINHNLISEGIIYATKKIDNKIAHEERTSTDGRQHNG
jgi:hypothetical protein